MKLKDGLEILLTDFNKAPFKDYDIPKMKEHINEVLNIKYPVFQGGMANIATGEFAAAVSNAGA